jgi:hypothetical protein
MKVGPWSFFANTASQSIGGPFKQGDCLHGISLTIQTESLSGLGSAFMRSVATHYGAKGLRFMLDVVRVPGMAKELGQGISPHDYFDGVLLGDHYEAAFGILLSAGWLPLQLAKDYYRDSASADYGLVMVKWLAKE